MLYEEPSIPGYDLWGREKGKKCKENETEKIPERDRERESEN